MDSRALVIASTAGTIAQLVMVISGHFDDSIAALFAVGGMTISLVAGLLYGLRARQTTVGTASLGGLLAGGICALLGIAVSYFLGDVPASLLLLGTASSAVTGAIGGLVGRVIATRTQPST